MSVDFVPPVAHISPDWEEETIRSWAGLSTRAGGRATHVTQALIGDRADELRRLFAAGRCHEARALIRDKRYVIALASIWGRAGMDDSERGLSAALVGDLRQMRRMPAVALPMLAQVFLERFDGLDAVEPLFGEERRGQLLDELSELLAQHETTPGRALLWSREGPRRFASAIWDEAIAPGEAIRRARLEAARGGRFMDALDDELYLEELRRLPFGHEGPALARLRERETIDAPHAGRLLGHAALEILIDRARETDQDPGEVWRDAVLAVAGDPRLRHSDAHAIWWQPLGRDRIDEVIAWMARTDLRAFLEALREYAETSGHESMRRLYPPRQTLLEGLLEREGIVRRSRLIVGSRVREEMKSKLPTSMHASLANLQGNGKRDSALIYLDCGAFHLIEGTHNMPLHVYLGTPSRRIIASTERRFVYESVTKDMPEDFAERWEAARPDAATAGHSEISHRGFWQERLLRFLAEAGIRIASQLVLTTEDYVRLRNHGIPVVRSERVDPLPLEGENDGAS
ncbi:EH signature domain-containing protein [Microbacterium sp. gxy059]|uniref:EH signature domain-containing protein n=1 Tax=Microbacterium sp. gxy059 TaxID=2957199 RepID=UPI003D976E5E